MLELVAALPPERAAGFVAALGDRLAGRLGAMEIDEGTDDAMVSDLAPVFAAAARQSMNNRETSSGLIQAGR